VTPDKGTIIKIINVRGNVAQNGIEGDSISQTGVALTSELTLGADTDVTDGTG
jgi:hypothetical protein